MLIRFIREISVLLLAGCGVGHHFTHFQASPIYEVGQLRSMLVRTISRPALKVASRGGGT